MTVGEFGADYRLNNYPICLYIVSNKLDDETEE